MEPINEEVNIFNFYIHFADSLHQNMECQQYEYCVLLPSFPKRQFTPYFIPVHSQKPKASLSILAVISRLNNDYTDTVFLGFMEKL